MSFAFEQGCAPVALALVRLGSREISLVRILLTFSVQRNDTSIACQKEGTMHLHRKPEERRREIELLNNLQDDLAVLENAWSKKKISPQKAAKHLVEIIESVCGVARAGSMEQFERICIDIHKRLGRVQEKEEELGKRQWALISEMMELVKSSCDTGDSPEVDPRLWNESWGMGEAPLQTADDTNAPASADTENGLPFREEKQMSKTLRTSAKELLQKAQEALSSGNGESAKDLAMQAAELLAKVEAEEARKKEKSVRADLELAVHEEAEAEEALSKINEELTDRQNEVNQFNNKLSEARSSFTEQQSACQSIKEQVETIEAEISRLNEERKGLLEQFQEALPARDAAERECIRLKNALDKLTPELELILDSAKAAEDQAAKSRQKRELLAVELDNAMAKINA